MRPILPRGGAAALALLAAAAAAQPAAAEEAAGPAPDRSIEAGETPWQVSCTPEAEGTTVACSMIKSLTIGEAKTVVAQAAVVAGEPPALRFLAPHGMSLPDGLAISVDGRALATAPYRTSLPGGAIAVIELTPEIEGALAGGRRLRIEGVQNNGSPLAFEMSLTGFAASLAKLR
ncbi:MAG: invasion associated locus B family protein [Rhodobacteraceae bacterium]|nr:invasion associated locus B family protein [Paracoccaceae bacterium]